jgi:hypothetical protein
VKVKILSEIILLINVGNTRFKFQIWFKNNDECILIRVSMLCVNMLLDCIFLHIMLERTPNKKNIYIFKFYYDVIKIKTIGKYRDMADVISSVKISKNSTWIPLDSTHINAQFCRRRMTSRIPLRRQWGLLNCKWGVNSREITRPKHNKKKLRFFFVYFGTHSKKIHTISKQTGVNIYILSILLFCFYT